MAGSWAVRILAHDHKVGTASFRMALCTLSEPASSSSQLPAPSPSPLWGCVIIQASP
jgi:hypothetical protein